MKKASGLRYRYEIHGESLLISSQVKMSQNFRADKLGVVGAR